MDTVDAGRMGGLKGGRNVSERKRAASRRNLELARQSRWVSRIGTLDKNESLKDSKPEFSTASHDLSPSK